MGSFTESTLSATGNIVGNSKIVVLEPEKWIGKRFPLLSHIEGLPILPASDQCSLHDSLAEGNWLVVLYHHNCLKCEAALPKYESLANQSEANPASLKVALIEVPPYGGPDTLPLSPNTHCILGRLTDTKDWFVESPAYCVIRDGSCVEDKDITNDLDETIEGKP